MLTEGDVLLESVGDLLLLLPPFALPPLISGLHARRGRSVVRVLSGTQIRISTKYRVYHK